MSVGAVILAAGAASRMGRTKQLLPYQGGTLVEHAVKQAEQAGFAPIVVVLGADAAAVGQAVGRTSADCVVNENWALGMGSSIRCGVERMLGAAPEIEAMAILLADQPRIGALQLREMKREFEAGAAAILAAKYGGSLGVPAMFKRSVFSKLQSLAPGAGARLLLRDGGVAAVGFELPEAEADVDTPGDYSALAL